MQRKTMALTVVVIAGISAVTGLIMHSSIKAAADETYEAQSRRAPVLVELFTSEGCSSCPSADKVLASLVKLQPVNGARIIALGEHVDYWNRLGWRDPFSSSEFTDRQSEYAQALRLNSVYTPQMVVDGQTEFVGSESDRAENAIAQAARIPKARVTISRSEARSDRNPNALPLQVHIDPAASGRKNSPADIFLAITEDNLSSAVRRGENSGRTLDHIAVVRQLNRIGSLPENGTFSSQPSVALVSGWKQKNLSAVVFIQDRSNHRILGVGSLPLSR